MKTYHIGLLGFGTVGAGVVDGLRRNGDLIASRLGARPVVRRIADLDLARDRGVAVDADCLTTDAGAVVDDPAVDIVIELIGGTGAAGTLIRRALSRGKPVVTANKALLAKQGQALFALAAAHATDLYFGASVGGGIPIIRALREGLIGNRIDSLYGILNGTCNYILTRMEADGLDFETALGEAAAQGYAEADPGLDIDGFDTAHKAVILARLAYGYHASLDAIMIEGIRGLGADDVRYGRSLGYRIKLLAVVKREGDAIEVRVHPALVPLDHMLATVSGVYNAVMVRGDLTGDTLYYGRGAGREPAASTVIGDVCDVIRNLEAGSPRRFRGEDGNRVRATLRPPGDVETRFYLRLSLLDKPGTLARITRVLGDHGISIASVLQQEGGVGDYVPVVIITHRSREAQCDAALVAIAQLDVVNASPIRLRIEG